jgi:murein DD-endopeptidase MepM/ murein hydrolase activator NlpD
VKIFKRRRGRQPGSFLAALLCALGILLVLPFCSQAEPARDSPSPQALQTGAQTPQAEQPARKAPRFALIPGTARPGEPVTVGYSDDFIGKENQNFQALLLDSRGKRLGKAALFSLGHEEGGRELKAALLAIPSTAESGPALIRIQAADSTIKEFPLTIEKRDFVSELIPLDKNNTNIRTVPDPQKTAEAERLWAILSHTGSSVYCSGPFVPPVASTRRTSFFGDRRVYQYVTGASETSIHAGIDYGVSTGTEVKACAPGKVVLACFRIVTGNSVVIEHMPGVYSLYYHLDQLAVSEGALVSEGTLVGLSGSTGLATGPHLHWEIRTAGESSDPDAFAARAVLDKNAILSNLIE